MCWPVSRPRWWSAGQLSLETLGDMVDTSAILSGSLLNWPSKDGLASILREAGLRVYVGRYSIRVEDCSHFSFEHYAGDLGDPQIDADADSAPAMIRDGKLVSDVLAKARLVHRFEVYDHRDEMVAYLHFGWPQMEDA